MNNGPSGFHNAPVTKGLLITCAIASIIIGMKGGSIACALSYQAIMRKLHLWRLVSSALVFSSTPEVMLGMYLLYYFRVFERQIGSNKYSVFVLFSTIFATLFELIALAIFKDPTPSGLAPGPYGLIFASFIPFFFDIPISTRFRVFSVQFSDKSFVYLAGIQLLLSSWKKSLIPGLCGVFAGISYRLNVFGIRRIKFPELVASTISRFYLPSVSAGPSAAPSRGNIARETVDPFGRQFEGDFTTTAPLLSSIEDPSEEAISTLVSMGFDRTIAIQSLIQGGNDINVATNILLEGQTH